MDKELITKILNDIFIPLKYKKKGNNWILSGDNLIKVVNIQKSSFGSIFYINYGFIIKGLELTTKTHLEYRVASTDRNEQKHINELQDFSSNLDIEVRREGWSRLINDKIVQKFDKINTEQDLLHEIKKLPNLNAIPLNVKMHFGL